MSLSTETRWCSAVVGPDALAPTPEIVLGVLPGEGVGPDLTASAVHVLRAVEAAGLVERAVRVVPGPPADAAGVSPEVGRFFDEVTTKGGAVLAGAVGGRFVYDLRRRLDLFCKLVPVRPWEALTATSPFRPEHLRGVDLVIVRENVGGVYQGTGRHDRTGGEARAEHTFGYTEGQIVRIVRVAARIAAMRSGRLAVVVKNGGVPEVSALWRDAAERACDDVGIDPEFVDVDLCAYRLVQAPRSFDVVAAPNLFGDVLADISALLLGARGVSYSGNFSASGTAVYQTNHGAAFDLVGVDAANPVGQISALAMLLHESAGEPRAARAVVTAIEAVWQAGYRTADVAGAGDRVVGTAELTDRIVAAIR